MIRQADLVVHMHYNSSLILRGGQSEGYFRLVVEHLIWTKQAVSGTAAKTPVLNCITIKLSE